MLPAQMEFDAADRSRTGVITARDHGTSVVMNEGRPPVLGGMPFDNRLFSMYALRLRPVKSIIKPL